MVTNVIERKCIELGYGGFDDMVGKIRSAVPLSDLIASLSGLRYSRKRGVQFTGCCPFHEEKDPSFRVNDRAGFYCASTSCGAQGGDIYSFVQQYEGLDFLSAVARVAKIVGMPCPDFGSSSRPMHPNSRGRRLRDVSGPIPSAQADEEAPENSVADWEWIKPPFDDVPSAGLAYYLPAKAEFVTRKFSALYRYRSTDGELIHLVGRHDYEKAGKRRKSIVPLTWRRRPEEIGPNDPDADCWVAAGIPEELARPVYRAERLGRVDADDPEIEKLTILYVEGEKTADAAARLVEILTGPEPVVVLSPQGGSGAAARADWDALLDVVERFAGVEVQVLIWPDADRLPDDAEDDAVDPVRRSVDLFATAIVRAMASRDKPELVDIAYVTPPDGVAAKWDLANAEEEGWDGERVLRHMAGCVSLSGSHKGALIDPGSRRAGDWDGIDDRDFVFSGDEEQEGDAREDIGGRLFRDSSGRLRPAPGQPPFRPLGFNGDHWYLHVQGTDLVSTITASELRGPKFLLFADYDWYQDNFGNDQGKVNWMMVANSIISQCKEKGQWDPSLERREGVWRDGGNIIVNYGKGAVVIRPDGTRRESSLYDLGRDEDTRHVYTMDRPIEAPDFDRALAGDDPDLKRFVKLLHDLPWQSGTGRYSPVILGGWIGLSFICGIVPWRPHVWLDGARASGKSWVINNLIAEAVDEFGLHIKSNSTEPGIRRRLEGRAMAVVFDEAEAEDAGDRARMQGVIKILRHITSGERSEVVQAEFGKQTAVSFRPKATFLMSSINVSLMQSSDLTRFARLTFGKPLPHEAFARLISGPAKEILTSDFRRRLSARMIMRAHDYEPLLAIMTEAIINLTGCDRRTVDVHAALLSSYYLLFEDRPVEMRSVLDWIGETVLSQLSQRVRPGDPRSVNAYDHEEIITEIMSHRIQVETDSGRFTETVSMVIQAALDEDGDGSRTSRLAPSTAMGRLAEMGIRVIRPGEPSIDDFIAIAAAADPDLAPDMEKLYERGGLLIAKKHSEIRKALEQTAWRDSYQNVLLQTHGAIEAGRLRFAGVSRNYCIFIPFRSMPMLDGVAL